MIKYIFLIGLIVLFSTGCAVKISLEDYKPIKGIEKLDTPTPKKYNINSYNILAPNEKFKNIFLKKLRYSNYVTIDKDDKTRIIVDIGFNKISTSKQYVSQKFIENVVKTKQYQKKCIKNRSADCNYKCSFFSYQRDKEYCLSNCMFKMRKHCRAIKKGRWTKAYWKYQATISVNVTVVKNKTKYSIVSTASDNWTTTSQYNNSNYIPQNILENIYAILSDNIIEQLASIVVKNGTIIDIRQNKEDKDEKIFLINMGTNSGLWSQQKCFVFKQNSYIPYRSNYNKCTISNQIYSNWAWIVMDEDEDNKKVILGDKVKFLF